MKYDFKLVEEIAWAAVVTAVVYVLTAFVATNETTNWQVWLTAVGGGAARAAAGVVLARITRQQP